MTCDSASNNFRQDRAREPHSQRGEKGNRRQETRDMTNLLDKVGSNTLPGWQWRVALLSHNTEHHLAAKLAAPPLSSSRDTELAGNLWNSNFISAWISCGQIECLTFQFWVGAGGRREEVSDLITITPACQSPWSTLDGPPGTTATVSQNSETESIKHFFKY